MKRAVLKQYASLSLVFALVCAVLFVVDYEGQSKDTPTSVLTKTLQELFDSSSINDALLASTSLRTSEVTKMPADQYFLNPYLSVSGNTKVQHFFIRSHNIVIDVIESPKNKEVFQNLLKKQGENFDIHQVNNQTFYLNEQPPEQKTANFLARMVGNTIYGFRYAPLHHRKVLEIIDALEQNE